jgi:hypothetical protein
MPISFSSNGAARFSAVTSLDWDNITGKPDIIEFPALSTEGAVARYADAAGNIEDSDVLIGDSGNITLPGYVDIAEVAAPSSPSANTARLYAKDDGAGVTKMFYKNSAGTEAPLGGRIVLAANTTYTVGSAGTYASLQAAYEYVQENIDKAGYKVTFSLTDASLTTSGDVLTGPLFGGGLQELVSGSGDRILTRTTNGNTIELRDGAQLDIGDGVKLTNSGGAGGTAVFVRKASMVRQSGNMIWGGGADTVDVALQDRAGFIRAASARFEGIRARHVSGSSNSNMSTDSGITTTFAVGSEVTEAFAYSHASARLCFHHNEIYSGTLTGPKFLLEGGGHIFTNFSGLSFLPGTTAGTINDATSSYDNFSGILRINFNTSAADTITGGVAYFTGNDSANPLGVFDSYAGQSGIVLRRANGTQASKSALANNDQISSVSARGYGTSAYGAGRAAVNFYAGEAWTNSAQGAYITISATPTGGTTLTEAWRTNGVNITASLPRYGADGSAGAPAYAFTTQATTGAYYTANTYNIATQGTLRASISSSGLVLSTPLLTASGGLGAAVPASIMGASANLDMNVTTDQALTVTLPSGYTKYKVLQILVYEASTSLTTAAGGIYTAAAKGGVQVVPSSQAYSAITATTADTLAGAVSLSQTNSNGMWLTDTTLFFSLTTPQGSAATAKIVVYIMILP